MRTRRLAGSNVGFMERCRAARGMLHRRLWADIVVAAATDAGGAKLHSTWAAPHLWSLAKATVSPRFGQLHEPTRRHSDMTAEGGAEGARRAIANLSGHLIQ